MSKAQRTQQIQRFFESMANLQRLIDGKGLNYLQKLKLSRPQAVLMFFISHKPDCGIKDIAEVMNFSSSAATQMVEGLVAQGLLSREMHPKDRRSVIIKLSRKGQQRFNQFKKIHFQYMQKLLSGLSDQEMNVLINLPIKMSKQLQAFSHPK